MKYELCIACDHCDPSKTNDRQQVFCEINPPYVDPFNGCDEFKNKALDECFKNIGKSELTDKEIIKALECCISIEGNCDICPYNGVSLCGYKLCSDVLDLINRQQAEIESDKAKKEICAEVIDRQDKEIERLQGILLAFMDEVARWEVEEGIDVSRLPMIPICDEGRACIDRFRARAIKQFAERLKHMLGVINGFDYDCSTIFYHIDNLVAEMVGDNNAEN